MAFWHFLSERGYLSTSKMLALGTCCYTQEDRDQNELTKIDSEKVRELEVYICNNYHYTNIINSNKIHKIAPPHKVGNFYLVILISLPFIGFILDKLSDKASNFITAFLAAA